LTTYTFSGISPVLPDDAAGTIDFLPTELTVVGSDYDSGFRYKILGSTDGFSFPKSDVYDNMAYSVTLNGSKANKDWDLYIGKIEWGAGKVSYFFDIWDGQADNMFQMGGDKIDYSTTEGILKDLLSGSPSGISTGQYKPGAYIDFAGFSNVTITERDVIVGSSADDRFAGGKGNDKISSGGGTDVFVYDGTRNEGKDLISGFTDGKDKIEIAGVTYSDLIIGSTGRSGKDTSIQLSTGTEIILKKVDKSLVNQEDFVLPDDLEPTIKPKVSVSNAYSIEGGYLKFVVSMSEALDEDVVVNYKIRLGSLVVSADSSDFENDGLAGSLTIKAGRLSAGAFENGLAIKTIDDAINERNFEFLSVKLTEITSGNAVFSKDVLGLGTIADNDDPAGSVTRSLTSGLADVDMTNLTNQLAQFSAAAYGELSSLKWLEDQGWTLFNENNQDAFFSIAELNRMRIFETIQDDYNPLTGPGSTTNMGNPNGKIFNESVGYKFEDDGYVISTGIKGAFQFLDRSAGLLLGRSADSLVVSFTGTNEPSDSADWVQMGKHFQQLIPVLNRLVTLVSESPDIKNVYFAGHSLGAGMAEAATIYYKSIFEAAGTGVTVKGVNFASPGYEVDKLKDILLAAGSVLGEGLTGGLQGAALEALKIVTKSILKGLDQNYLEQFNDPELIESFNNENDIIGLAAFFQNNIGDKHKINFSDDSSSFFLSGDSSFFYDPTPKDWHSMILYADAIQNVIESISDSKIAKLLPFRVAAEMALKEYSNIIVQATFTGTKKNPSWDVGGGIEGTVDKFRAVDGKSNVMIGTNEDDIFTATYSIESIIIGKGGDDFMKGGLGSDNIDGGRGRDTLLGGKGSDRLVGGDGFDEITGGAGRDVMWGGKGIDLFVFKKASDSKVSAGYEKSDVIKDFSVGLYRDTIDLSKIDARSGISLKNLGDQDFTFIGDASAFSGSKGELRYLFRGEDTIILGDQTGDQKADFAIVLEGLHTLQAVDFIL
jgi:Ca2+-binding RTX toxin-like protein